MDLRQFLSKARRSSDRLAFIKQTGRLFYAFDWLRAGSGITLDRQPDGVEIGLDRAALAAVGPNDKVAASSSDTPGYLDAKVANSLSVSGNRLQLTNDSASPSADAFYGSDGASARGYHGFTEIDVVTDVGLDDAGDPLLQTRAVFVWSPGDPTGYTDPTEVVATPAFAPDGGSHVSSVDVTISCATAGASIYYTTNGSDPTEASTLYTSPVTITVDGTVLKARAYKAGLTPSNIKSATYEIVAAVDPDDVTGLLWWFRPDELSGLSDGDPVSTWADASGNGYNATARGSARPTFKAAILNGYDAVLLDGSLNWMSIAAGSAGEVPDWSAIAVVSVGSSGAKCLSSVYNLPDHGWVFRVNNNKANSYGNNGGTGVNVNGATDVGGWGVVGARTDSPNEQSVYLNGTLDASTDPSKTLAYASSYNTLGALIYGSGPSIAEQTDGYIVELAVWDRAISEADLASVSASLAAKYGLA